MFKIKTLTVKNFMSVGNATQAVHFDRRDLTLVLGVNIDLGGDDSGARNGTGKTTIINALSYALYGQALTNIRRDNLINKTNAKGMLVTVEFDYGGETYRIERGRKPTAMKFFVGDVEKEITDMAQGDSRETQADINRMLGMSHEMFKHLIALNTYTEPFLNLKAKQQQEIIEQLLGITILSEKADKLKEALKGTRENITKEEYSIKAQEDANARITEQIENLKRRQKLWQTQHDAEVEKLQLGIAELEKVDIDQELRNHKALQKYTEYHIAKNELDYKAKSVQRIIDRETQSVTKLTQDIEKLDNNLCSTCGQPFVDNARERILKQKQESLQDAQSVVDKNTVELTGIESQIQDLGTVPESPEVFYAEERDAFEHRSSLQSLVAQLRAKEKQTDPYQEQILEMESTGIKDVSWDTLNELQRLKEHQDFLLKLLTNKDSFIRKRIIDQNLSYLNMRLSYYLEKIGLPHTVRFQNDLTVNIEELGRELDFDNLSRGERNRLILSLSWAFRDVYESLYQMINVIFIDELIDSGMDASGVESSMAILKKMAREHNKSVWLVSHKDELSGRVNNIMTVTKENGFTTYGTEVDIV
jgi:DNA repair exonuclease SbcCD ATPase subunit